MDKTIYRVMIKDTQSSSACVGYVVKTPHVYYETKKFAGVSKKLRTGRSTETFTWIAVTDTPGSGGFYIDRPFGGRVAKLVELRATPPWGERTRKAAVQLVLDWYESTQPKESK